MPHELIRYRPEHRPDAARLLTEFWPDPAVNAAQVSWLHEQNPYTDHPFIYLLFVDGKAVGMQAYYGGKYEIAGSGETFDAVCATMAVNDKSVRGRGFATVILKGALKDIAANGYPYAFSFSSRPIPYMSQLRRGWRLAGDYRTMAPEKRPGAGGLPGGLRRAASRRFPLLRKLWHRTGRQVLKRQKYAYTPLDALNSTELDGGTLSVSREADAPAMAELASAVAIPGRIRHLRDPAYFAWRYKSPRMDYRFIYWHDTKLRGFLVLQKTRGSAEIIRIADWEATNEQVLKRLFHVAFDSGKFASLTIWSAALSEEMVSFLSDSGFAPIDESRGVADYRPGLLVKSLGDTASDGGWEVSGHRIDDLANWDLRPIYSDYF